MAVAAVAGGGSLAVDLLAVEVAVTAAGGAGEGLEGALVAAGHELAAAVGGVAAHGSGVVLEALAVADELLEGGGGGDVVVVGGGELWG